jgi:predicted Ser/Thr protein kinase
MGRVYRARQLRLDRFVAVKLMHAELGRDPEFRDRFEREARALARLDHPSIVRVHDFGEVEGTFYLIMEYVDGTNLRELILDGLEPVAATRIIAQLCDALAYAHAQGVVHRDIKPENVLINRDGTVKVADFGLAKLQKVEARTRTHRVVGTPQYMAPEQLRDPSSVDHRADVFAIGVVFYEMLTGQLPVGRFPAPSELGHGDAHLDAVVLRALESNRERRYQAASEIQAALETQAGLEADSGRAYRGRGRMVAWAGGLGLAGVAALAGLSYGGADTQTADVAQAGTEPSEARRIPPAAHRWPAVELAALGEDVGAVVGIDWAELQQAPALARLDAAMGDDTAWVRCRDDVVAKTHKLLVVFDGEGMVDEVLVHGDWDPSSLEPCLRMIASQVDDAAEGVSVTRGTAGPHVTYSVVRPGAEPDALVVGRDGQRILLRFGAANAVDIDARLARRAGNDIVQSVAPTTDLDAPLWVLSDPFPSAWHPSVLGLSGHVDVWDNIEAHAVVRFATEDEALRASKLVDGYAAVAANMMADVDIVMDSELDGKTLTVHGSMPIPKNLGSDNVSLRSASKGGSLGFSVSVRNPSGD